MEGRISDRGTDIGADKQEEGRSIRPMIKHWSPPSDSLIHRTFIHSPLSYLSIIPIPSSPPLLLSWKSASCLSSIAGSSDHDDHSLNTTTITLRLTKEGK